MTSLPCLLFLAGLTDCGLSSRSWRTFTNKSAMIAVYKQPFGASCKSIKMVAQRCRCLTVAPLPPPNDGSTLTDALDKARKMSGRNPGATISLRVKLNLDPRQNGQKLKGVLEYAHSTGKGCLVAVYTTNPQLAAAAKSAGASFAGDIVDQITYSDIQCPKDFERLITTVDLEHVVVHRKLLLERMKRKESATVIVPELSNEVANILRVLQIVPSIRDRTLVQAHEVEHVVRGYTNGSLVRYATDSDGNLTTRIGKLSMTDSALLDNLNSLLHHLFATRPLNFGTGPRAKKHNRGIYVLSLHLLVASLRIDPIRLDLSSLDILNEKNHSKSK